MRDLTNKKILFIICGGISAYKSLETIRLLKKDNAEIRTILTKSAKEFVTPLSIASLSQGKVYEDLFNVENESEMDQSSNIPTNPFPIAINSKFGSNFFEESISP